LSIPAIFAVAFVVGMSGAMSPGPLLTATVGESYRRGFIAGPLLVAGHATLEALLLIALLLGLGRLFSHGLFFAGTALAGGAFLLWMGCGMALEAKRDPFRDFGDPSPLLRWGPFAAGFLVSLSNPYWILWWATFGLGYLTRSMERGVPGVASFYLGHISADAAWYLAVALLVATGRRFLPGRFYRAVMAGCALFLVVLGGRFAADGLSRFL
jgi:threonine/homoserine/homoserine lactone efflux protein